MTPYVGTFMFLNLLFDNFLVLPPLWGHTFWVAILRESMFRRFFGIFRTSERRKGILGRPEVELGPPKDPPQASPRFQDLARRPEDISFLYMNFA